MNNEIDHNTTDEITCPWCGYEDTDSWEYKGEEHSNPSNLGLIECGSCEKHFNAVREIEVYYSTEKAAYGKCERCQKEDKLLDECTVGYDEKSYQRLYQMLCEECGQFVVNVKEASMIQQLKVHKEYFEEIVHDRKTFEVRKKDRKYKTGNYICLNEVDDIGEYKGRSILLKITYILDNPKYCKEGYIIMGIKPCKITTVESAYSEVQYG